MRGHLDGGFVVTWSLAVGELLLASTLRLWAQWAWPALCRVLPEDVAWECPEPVAAELAAMRMAAYVPSDS